MESLGLAAKPPVDQEVGGRTPTHNNSTTPNHSMQSTGGHDIYYTACTSVTEASVSVKDSEPGLEPEEDSETEQAPSPSDQESKSDPEPWWKKKSKKSKKKKGKRVDCWEHGHPNLGVRIDDIKPGSSRRNKNQSTPKCNHGDESSFMAGGYLAAIHGINKKQTSNKKGKTPKKLKKSKKSKKSKKHNDS
ncbi:hypothetical protein FRC11_012172, partial [Ceratobasidium sp. 423]